VGMQCCHKSGIGIELHHLARRSREREVHMRQKSKLRFYTTGTSTLFGFTASTHRVSTFSRRREGRETYRTNN
jgi:hypothetical protein